MRCEERGGPDKKRVNHDLRGLGVGGDAREHIEQNTETARDLTGPGKDCPAFAKGEPSGHEACRGSEIHQMGQSDGNDQNRKKSR